MNSSNLYSINIGYQSGQTQQQTGTIAIGYQAGQKVQGTNAIALGVQTGMGMDGLTQKIGQGTGAIAIGYQAGQTASNNTASVAQGVNAVAIGVQSGQIGQSSGSIAVGYQAGNTGQGSEAISIGDSAGNNAQQTGSIAIGYQAGQKVQGTNAIALGAQAGSGTTGTTQNLGQGINAIAIGVQAGQAAANVTSTIAQGANAIAIGFQAGQTGQSTGAIAIGYQAGLAGANATAQGQGTNAIAIGVQAGQTGQGSNSIAIGTGSGQFLQAGTVTALAFITQASRTTTVATIVTTTPHNLINNQQVFIKCSDNIYDSTINPATIGVGSTSNQFTYALTASASALTAVTGTVYLNKGDSAVAIGTNAGQTFQTPYSVAMGYQSGVYAQGAGFDTTIVGYNSTVNVSAVSRNANVATITTTTNHNLVTNQIVTTSISVAGFFSATNVTVNVTGLTTFTYNNTGPNVGNTVTGGSVIINTSINTVSRSSNIATITTPLPHNLIVGQYIRVVATIATTFNTFNTVVLSVSGLTQFSYSNPGADFVATTDRGTIYIAGDGAVAIGSYAGQTNQGGSAVAVGSYAGQTSQNSNTIVINASGLPLNTITSNATYVAPIRDCVAGYVHGYNRLTKEIGNFGSNKKYYLSGTTAFSVNAGATCNAQLFFSANFSSYYVKVWSWVFPVSNTPNPDNGGSRNYDFSVRRAPSGGGVGGYTTYSPTIYMSESLGNLTWGTVTLSTSGGSIVANNNWTSFTGYSTTVNVTFFIEMITVGDEKLSSAQITYNSGSNVDGIAVVNI